MNKLESLILKHLDGQVSDGVKQTMAVFIASDVEQWAWEIIGENEDTEDVTGKNVIGYGNVVGFSIERLIRNQFRERLRERIKESVRL
jgi:hypothetical protein